MKKLLAITVLLCFAGLSQLFAVNPIPSYNVLVTGKAIFQESTTPFFGNGVPTDAKRKMNIVTSTASPSGSSTRSIISVRVYRLDGQVVLGPYYLVCGQSLQVGIDFKKWGVDVTTQETSCVSVWTSTEY